MYNLLLQAYNNTFAGNHALYETIKQQTEIHNITQKYFNEQRAKEAALMFIYSRGLINEFKEWCVSQTCNPSTDITECKAIAIELEEE